MNWLRWWLRRINVPCRLCGRKATISCSNGHPICRQCFLDGELTSIRDTATCCSNGCIEAPDDCEALWMLVCEACPEYP
jgi:hypothetical protein